MRAHHIMRMGAIVGWLISTSSAFGSDTPEQLLTIARDGNRTAIQSIQTMECRYQRIPWAGTTLPQAQMHFMLPAGRFWRSGETYRFIKPMNDGSTREYVARNGQGLWRQTGGLAPNPSLTRSTLTPADGVGGEMWQYLLFSHWGWVPPPTASYYTLHEILQHPHVLHSAERLPSGEIHVHLSHGGVKRQEFWFDPKVNYLVRKSVWTPAGDATYRWEHEVIEFTEAAPQVFVPTTIEIRCFVKEKQEATIRTLISYLKVNHDMPTADLRLPGIAGRSCLDLDRNVRYNVDADGNQMGPEMPVEGAQIGPDGRAHQPLRVTLENPHPLPLASSDSVQSGRSLPSPPPTLWWVLGIIAVVVILLVALTLNARGRQQKAVRMRNTAEPSSFAHEISEE